MSLQHRFLIATAAIITAIVLLSPINIHADGPIRIGATISKEGRYTDLSYMVKSGYEIWAEQVNEQGGLLGRKVELIFYDDKSRKELVAPL